MEIKNKVIIWGPDSFNTLGLIRQLGSKELDLLFLIKGRKSTAAKSKYCPKCVETQTIEDGYNYLMENYSNQDDKPILLTSSDAIMTFIDRHKEDFERSFITPGTTVKGDTEKYIDKNAMTALANEIGILCPESIAINKGSDIGDIKYPCFIKPSHEKPGHYNEFKFKLCKNKRALKRTLRCVRPDSQFILQRYIQKESDLLVYGARMWDGNTVIAGAFIRDRLTCDGSSSHGLFTNEVPASADTSKICEFLERIDYHGIFSFEYGLIGDKAYFFEVNLRNDGTSHYFYQAGANIPLAYVYSSAGLDYSEIPTKIKGENWYIDELYDVENVLSRRVSIRKWKQQKAEATIFRFYDENDIEPYRAEKKRRTKRIIEDLILRRFRMYIVFVLDKLGFRK